MVKEKIENIARELGFDLVGFAAAEKLEREKVNLEEWLRKGFNGSMGYMERNIEKRYDIRNILPSANTVISLGMNYYTGGEYSEESGRGKISRYALGDDYHEVIWEKLDQFIKEIKILLPDTEAISYVDTGPLMDKVWGGRAGIGWQGKNTNLINREIGSWFFIATVLTNIKLDEYDAAIEDYCGSCTACLDACPTGALVEEYKIDGSKCISYLTIENKGEIGEEFKGKMDNWLFGCDVCQEVCPWNRRFSTETGKWEFKERNGMEIELERVEKMEPEEFSRLFKKSPIKRSKLKGLKRNALFLKGE